MRDNKVLNKSKIEIVLLLIVLSFILVNAIIVKDSLAAVISAICGIIYTSFAGKGRPICYLFGVVGSSFYCFLSFKNALWGNLLLYAGYYIPMQILGFFQWNKNLKQKESVIVKTFLKRKELINLIAILSILFVIVYRLLLFYNDANPVLDTITTVLSIGGMYLTVKRAIEQWLFWGVVNAVSLAMWLMVAISGEKVYSTVVMWAVYLVLAVYFYIEWKKELNNL